MTVLRNVQQAEASNMRFRQYLLQVTCAAAVYTVSGISAPCLGVIAQLRLLRPDIAVTCHSMSAGLPRSMPTACCLSGCSTMLCHNRLLLSAIDHPGDLGIL